MLRSKAELGTTHQLVAGLEGHLPITCYRDHGRVVLSPCLTSRAQEASSMSTTPSAIYPPTDPVPTNHHHVQPLSEPTIE